MRTLKISAVFLLCVSVVLVSGCSNSELKDLRIKNETQRQHIEQLQAELQAGALQVDELKRKLAYAEETGGIEADMLKQQIAALEEDLAKKNELLTSMQQKLLNGTALPIELSTMLENFAKTHGDIVSFDANTGIVKFKSDLLFEKGSATVASSAIEAVKSLCGILNSDGAKKFDIVIAGHTDNVPIYTERFRSNWELSAARAVSVAHEMMLATGIASDRFLVQGLADTKPMASNDTPAKRASNRRVEIILQQGEDKPSDNGDISGEKPAAAKARPGAKPRKGIKAGGR